MSFDKKHISQQKFQRVKENGMIYLRSGKKKKKKTNFQPRIIQLAKLSFRSKGKEIKHFQDKQNQKIHHHQTSHMRTPEGSAITEVINMKREDDTKLSNTVDTQEKENPSLS